MEKEIKKLEVVLCEKGPNPEYVEPDFTCQTCDYFRGTKRVGHERPKTYVVCKYGD